jgi:hypothetical protein
MNANFELIVEPKNNIYFRLDNIESELDVKYKVLAWLSRPSCKGVSDYWQKRMRNIVNEVLNTDFSWRDMNEIYTRLGNDCNRTLAMQFIASNYDLTLLKKD